MAALSKTSQRSRSGFIKAGLILTGIAAACGSTWWGYRFIVPSGVNNEKDITVAAKRGDLAITVVERGEVESSKTIDVRCDVEGHQIKIVTIVPEGKAVKKDDIVVTFDTDQLKRSEADQEVKVRQAKGKAEAAKSELEVQKNKAQTDLDKADLALKLAELDLEKYLKGDYVVELAERQGDIELAKKDLKEVEEKLEHFKKFVRQGFGTNEQLKVRQLEVEQKRFLLESKEAKLNVLKDFTRRRQETELKAKAKDAKLELDRTRSSGKAAIDKAQSELDAAEVSFRLETQTLDRLRKQIEKCTVKAPQEGIVVYSKERYWDPSSRVQPGAMVHYQQALFSLPDLTQMKVKTKIHEAMVKKLKQGQKAEIRVDAIPNLVMKGTVKSVATLANSEGYWDERGVKEYVTMIDIDQLPTEAGLKPGMTAEVKILVNSYSDRLLVPVQAVCQKDKQHFAYVQTATGIERREVKIGDNNEKYVEIQEGLSESERVCLDARARLQVETKNSEGQEEKLAPAVAAPVAALPASKP